MSTPSELRRSPHMSPCRRSRGVHASSTDVRRGEVDKFLCVNRVPMLLAGRPLVQMIARFNGILTDPFVICEGTH